MKYRCLIPAMALMLMLLQPAMLKADRPEVSSGIQTFNRALLTSMRKADELGFTGRYELLEPVVQEVFALSFMARKSLGRYWETLDEAQRSIYMNAYLDWSVASYAGQFNAYDGEQFKVLPCTECNTSTVTVISKLIKKGGESVDFHYKVRQRGTRWLIVDIQIEGVSQLALTRSQFISIIKRHGFETLIEQLHDKTEHWSKKKKS